MRDTVVSMRKRYKTIRVIPNMVYYTIIIYNRRAFALSRYRDRYVVSNCFLIFIFLNCNLSSWAMADDLINATLNKLLI